MNIASIIGQVDMYSAAVAVVMAGGGTVVLTTMIAKHQNSRKTDQQFELEKLRLKNIDADAARKTDVDREVKLGKIAADKQVEVTRIENGMVDVKGVRSSHPDYSNSSSD